MCIFADMQSKYNFIWLKLMAFFFFAISSHKENEK